MKSRYSNWHLIQFPLGDKLGNRSGSYYLPFSTYRLSRSQRDSVRGITFEHMKSALKSLSKVVRHLKQVSNFWPTLIFVNWFEIIPHVSWTKIGLTFMAVCLIESVLVGRRRTRNEHPTWESRAGCLVWCSSSNPTIAPRGAVERALARRIDLIVAEEATRKEEKHPMTEPDILDRIESLRSNVWGMMGDNESHARATATPLLLSPLNSFG